MIVTTVELTERELRAADACSDGIALFRTIAAEQCGLPEDEAPSVVVPNWTPLHSVWLAVVYPSHASWLRERGLIPRADLAGADLARANLAGANLADANLRNADLARAYLADAYLRNADLAGANLAGANLRGADLAGADLAGTNLVGASRRVDDAPIPGWTVRPYHDGAAFGELERRATP